MRVVPAQCAFDYVDNAAEARDPRGTSVDASPPCLGFSSRPADRTEDKLTTSRPHERTGCQPDEPQDGQPTSRRRRADLGHEPTADNAPTSGKPTWSPSDRRQRADEGIADLVTSRPVKTSRRDRQLSVQRRANVRCARNAEGPRHPRSCPRASLLCSSVRGCSNRQTSVRSVRDSAILAVEDVAVFTGVAIGTRPPGRHYPREM